MANKNKQTNTQKKNSLEMFPPQKQDDAVM